MIILKLLQATYEIIRTNMGGGGGKFMDRTWWLRALCVSKAWAGHIHTAVDIHNIWVHGNW